MYHRIADPAVDPWQLAVSPDRFDEHLLVLRETREPLAMSDFLHHLERGSLPANAVGLTFDDGYVDNLRAAKPRLERAGIPATVFITTGNVGTAREFWWDELARLVLGHIGDLDSEIVVASKSLRLTLRALSRGTTTFPRWEDSHPRTERESLYLEVWKMLRPLRSIEREKAMSNLRAILTNGPAAPEDLPMTEAQVVELAAGGVIEIGAHSVTHSSLTVVPADERRREIALSKSNCEQLAGSSVQGFAYPYGDFDDDTQATVLDTGFRFACSTNAQFVEVDRFDRFALPRLQVRNWAAEAFERALLGINGAGFASKRNSLVRLANLVKRHSRRLLQ
jgi:peptidoglycan/xylan/chitin deacetylase (PgdA/CDA1 family)